MAAKKKIEITGQNIPEEIKAVIEEDNAITEGKKTDRKSMFRPRIKKMAEWLAEHRIAAVVFEDNESSRSPAIRYFSNHPSDAILIITADGKTMLCPWDENLAALRSCADSIIPFTKYGRSSIKAIAGMLKLLKIPESAKIEIPDTMPYPQFLHYVDELPQYSIICRENGAHQAAVSCREIKDQNELSIIRKAAAITDNIIGTLEKAVKAGSIKTELDAAMLIEHEARAAGCEGTSFETLAAGPGRSFGIHAFPSYTAAAFPADGLSILDFGVNYGGYCSDVTLTIAQGTLTDEQEKQLALVEKAYHAALPYYAKDVPVRTAAAKADEVFSKAKRSMPHSLGHGVGLVVHETPVVKARAELDIVFRPGMIVTLEPGLYSPSAGGCRLENDILITETGNEELTHSHIIRI